MVRHARQWASNPLISIFRHIALIVGLVLAANALAAEKLDVQVDRTTLHENQTLTMTVTGEMPFTMDLDTLFNLNDLQLPEPEIKALQKDFEIVGSHQKYSLNSVNGDATATITWTYQLVPKKAGTLTIPSLNFRDAQSSPLSITVRPGAAPPPDGTAPPAFVEVTTDKSDVYVQEQLILTVQLYYQGNLIRGDLAQPEQDDAIIEPMGEQKEFSRIHSNANYHVVERKYVIYPQTAGTLHIKGIAFNGQARGADGRLNFLRDTSAPLDIPVKDIPASFTGKTWLPASSLELNETWSDPAQSIAAGKSITRTIKLSALGLLGSALPPLEMQYPDAVRSYPDSPELDSSVDSRTVTSARTQSTALVAVTPGQITLPETRVPWWDTVNDQERVAVIPEQTLTITPGKGAPAAIPPVKPDQAGTTTPSSPADKAPQTPVMNDSKSGNVWLWLSLILATGWALTVLFWWLNRKNRQNTVTVGEQPRQNNGEVALFKKLESAVDAGSNEVLTLMPQWAGARFDGHTFRSAADVARFSGDNDLEAALNDLQRHLYAKDAATTPWDGNNLKEKLKGLREQSQKKTEDDSLAPLYPQALHSASAQR
ncbi:BatD family protein [Marinobacter sp. 1Y8]